MSWSCFKHRNTFVFINSWRCWTTLNRCRAGVSVLGTVFQQRCLVVVTKIRASHGHSEMESDSAAAWHCKPAVHCGWLGGFHESPWCSGERGRHAAFAEPQWDQDHTTCPQVLAPQLFLLHMELIWTLSRFTFVQISYILSGSVLYTFSAGQSLGKRLLWIISICRLAVTSLEDWRGSTGARKTFASCWTNSTSCRVALI